MYTQIDYYKTKIINKMGQQFRIIEYPLIILFIITGAIFLMSSSDLVTIFLSIELQSYGLYLISSIYRNSELSTNAGLTYFLLGGLSSCIILLGQSLLYIHTGNTNLDGIYIINSILVNNIHETYMDKSLVITDIPHLYEYNIQLSLVIMSTGFLFKISSAPFHFWSPDVYDAIPTIVTTFVAIIAKISILIFFLELVYYTSLTLLDFSWKSNLLMSAFLSLIIGSILGLTQFRIKRLYAYSTISHVGFILLALSINSIESIQAFFFYIMQYSISNLNAFIILITIGYSFVQLTNKDTNSLENDTNLQDKNLSPIQLIHQIKGYFYVNPLLAISLSITLFSFIGVPPLIGFFAKQMILSAALDNGYVFMTLIAILTSVISAVYYLVVIQKIFFEKNDYMINDKWNDLYILVDTNKKKEKYKINSKDIFLSSSLTWNISVMTLGILLFIFIPKEIISISNIMSINVFYS
jgi:NADH-ubiquinone oxidoreductase chain 2